MTERIGAYSPETAKMILEVVNYLKKNGLVTKKDIRGTSSIEPVRQHVFKTTGTITARSGTTAGTGPAIRHWIPGEAGTANTIEEFNDGSVDLYSLAEQEIESDTYVVGVMEGASGKWVVNNEAKSTKRIRGICQDGTFTSASPADPITIGSIEGIDVVWTGAATISAYRPRLHKVWNGCEVAAEYNATSEQWEVYDAQSDKIVHGIKTEACEFKKLDGAAGWGLWDAGHEAAWIENVEVSAGCTITVTPNCGSPVDYDLDFVQEIIMESNVLYYTKCDGNYLIADARPCAEPDECGVTTYTSALDEFDALVWVEDVVQANPCTGGCVAGPEPTDPIFVVGQKTSVPCVP
jgi:hypothetical protein